MSYDAEAALLAALHHIRTQRLAVGGPVLGHAPVTVQPPPAGTFHGAAPVAPASGSPHIGPAPGAPGIAASQSFNNAPLQLGFQAQVPTSNQAFNPGQYGASVGGSQRSLEGLSALLQAQAEGRGGPSIADKQLQQTTQGNIANAYAMSQANPNDAGAMRNVQNQVGAINQQAAGQGALLRAQEQLNAQSQLGQLGLGQLGTAGRLMSDEEKMQLEQSQGNQNAGLHAQDTNAETSWRNQAGALGLLNRGIDAAGGAISGGASALAGWGKAAQPGAQTATDSPPPLVNAPPTDSGGWADYPGAGGFDAGPSPIGSIGAAHGGLIPTHSLLSRQMAYASGGKVPTYDYTGASEVGDPRMPNLLASLPATTEPVFSSQQPPQSPQVGVSPVGGAINAAVGAIPVVGGGYAAGQALDAALASANKGTHNNGLEGGDVSNAVVGKANDIWNTATGWLAGGGSVPGRAKVNGDSPDNDTVPAMLSPGEVVLPKSVVQAEDAPDKAAEFLAAVKKGKGPKPTFTDVLQSHRQMHERLKSIEQHLSRGGYA